MLRNFWEVRKNSVMNDSSLLPQGKPQAAPSQLLVFNSILNHVVTNYVFISFWFHNPSWRIRVAKIPPFSEASLGMSQEVCIWHRGINRVFQVNFQNGLVKPVLLTAEQRHCWPEMLSVDITILLPFGVSLSHYVLGAQLSHFFSPLSPVCFVDWGPRAYKDSAAQGIWRDYGNMRSSHHLKAGRSSGRAERLLSVKHRKYPTHFTCLNFSHQIPKLCEGQKLLSSYSVFQWLLSISVFLSNSLPCSAVMSW